MDEEEVRNIKLRTQIRTAKEVLQRVYERLQDFEDENSQVQLSASKLGEIVNEIEAEFLQEKR